MLAFEVAIRDGVRAHHWDFGDMPPIEGLSGTEVDDIIAYVRAVQDAEGSSPTRRPERPGPSAGPLSLP